MPLACAQALRVPWPVATPERAAPGQSRTVAPNPRFFPLEGAVCQQLERPVGQAGMWWRATATVAVAVVVAFAAACVPLAGAEGPDVPPGAANVVCYEEECFNLFPTPHCAREYPWWGGWSR